MVVTNPFRPTRFEHHEHPLIWLSPNVRSLEGLKSVYIAGTRGSGKTSLLKALNWRERLFNPTVRDQVSGPAEDYVAVYFRFPDYLSSALGLIDWGVAFPKSPTPELIAYRLFSQLVEFVACELVCEAFSSLRAAGRFKYSPTNETKTVEGILKEYPELLSGQREHCDSLDQLARLLRTFHQKMNVLITRGDVASLSDITLTAQPGVFINDVTRRVRELACSEEGLCSQDFHIKVCVDDCETLHPNQQKFLNSLVRTSKHPLFWIVSFVSTDYDSSSTVIHNQSLTDADRTQLLLDDMDENDFRSLCEAVSFLRVYYSDQSLIGKSKLSRLKEDFFNLQSVLGKTSVNKFLLETTKNSLSAEFADLLEKSTKSEFYRGEDSAPPIYETYVFQKLGDRSSDKRVKNKEAYLRRKQRAALLAICSEFRIANIPYAGTTVVVSMSNGCIRDYLEIMGSIVDEAVRRREIRSLRGLEYRRTPLSLDAQRQGIVNSSRAKFDGIRNNMEKDWAEASRIIEFLGKLTAKLQSNHNSLETLATPERGIMLFDLAAIEAPSVEEARLRRTFILNILRRCEADGLLRPPPGARNLPEDLDPNHLEFALHRRFAAAFGFSYRGPYAPVKMPMREFAEVCEGGGDLSIDEWVDRVYSHISKDEALHPRLI